MALTKEQMELLDAAVEKCGDQKKLAEYLGYNATYISQLKRGSAKLRPIVESALRGIVYDGGQKPVDRLIDTTLETVKHAIKASDDCLRAVAKCAMVNLVATLILCGLVVRMIWG